MKQMVTAVVVTHDAGEYLEETLRALYAQTRKPDRIVLVDTGIEPVSNLVVDELIKLSQKTPLAESLELATKNVSADENNWIWLLHDDSAPAADCLEQLLVVEEKSALLGIIGPKQMRWDEPRVISQLGLTLTPWGTPLSLVSGELDQSQHDDSDDVMAVGTSGALVRADVWFKVGGIDPKAPPLAADYDLSLRARLAGARVVVAPSARIRHASLSMSGARAKSWLGGTPKTAVRKAAIHLRYAYSPLWFALLFWFTIPLASIVRVFWRLLQKRPDLIGAEIAAGLWGYFTVFARLGARAKYPRAAVMAIRKSFDAPWSRVRAANRARLDAEETRELKAAFARGENELQAVDSGRGFVASGGLFWVALLLGLSYAFLPLGQAPWGSSVLPMAQNWVEVFERTGASWQPIGFGFFGPSEPFNWVLLGLASLTPWAPSLSLVWLLFLAPAIAFAGAWRVAALVSSRAWARSFAALLFALWPALLQLRADGQVASLVASIALPWLVFAIARAAGLGRSGSARSMRQTWSWVGLSGLLLAVVGVSSPILMIPILLALAVVAFARIRLFGYLFWIPLPFAALYTPLSVFLIAHGEPFALLADPSISKVSEPRALLEMWLPTGDEVLGYAYLTAFVFAALALLTRRYIVAGVVWLFIGATLVLFNFHAHSAFVDPLMSTESNLQLVNGSTSSLSAAISLMLAALLALTAEHAGLWSRRLLALGLLAVLLAPLAVSAATVQRNFELRDDRVVPWILQAAAESDAKAQVLRLTTSEEILNAQVIPARGVYLEDSNVAYRYSLAQLQNDARAHDLASLAAHLRAGAADKVSAELEQARVAYILVVNDNTDASIQLSNALDSLPQLEQAGTTEFGRLWRVTEAGQLPAAASASWWSVTKLVQFGVVVAFFLLAVPTATSKRGAKESSTFIDGEGDAQ